MIRLSNISKSYGNQSVLNAISYHFPQGERIALVGANGAGKSTLLNILCGEEDADSGDIVKPNKLSIGYLPQIPNPNPKPTLIEECVDGAKRVKDAQVKMEQALQNMLEDYDADKQTQFEKYESLFRDLGGLLMESKAKGILHGLGFDHVGPQGLKTNPLELSGGWRMRLELAKIFIDQPDFLVLDEPTNHLDLTSLTFVESYLTAFPGTLLFVSHDKSLLNRLSTMTCHLVNGQLFPYKGNFDKFLEAKELKETQSKAQIKQISKKINTLETFVARFGAKATKATQAQSRAKTIERLKTLQSSLGVENETYHDEIKITLPISQPSGRQVLDIKSVSLGYPQMHLLSSSHFSLQVQRGQKIAIIGPNGAGKSTFLKTLMGLVPPISGSIVWGHNTHPAYFSQDHLDSLDDSKSIMDNILEAHPSLTEKDARSLAGSLLFSGDDVYKKVGVLSGGEKSRVGLAKLLAQKANVLLLDEPTNHLDMLSVEILTEALNQYTGTLIFVSHDKGFINDIATHTLALSPKAGGALFEGDLDDYERLCLMANFPNVLIPIEEKTEAVAKAPPKDLPRPRATPSVSRLQKEVAALEKRIAETEEAITGLEEKMSQTLDFPSIGPLQVQHTTLRNTLASLENQWFSLSETLENAKNPSNTPTR